MYQGRDMLHAGMSCLLLILWFCCHMEPQEQELLQVTGCSTLPGVVLLGVCVAVVVCH
jgi:hypothetical protein